MASRLWGRLVSNVKNGLLGGGGERLSGLFSVGWKSAAGRPAGPTGVGVRLGLSFGVLAGLGYYCYYHCYCHDGRYRGGLHAVVNAAQAVGPRQQFNFIAEVVEKTASAVVFIQIVDRSKPDFFGGAPRILSSGSGFLIADDGLIVTNAHVIKTGPNVSVMVEMLDGSVYPGMVEVIDMKSDLATIRIRTDKKLPTLKMGNSKDLRPGEWVVALGSPLSLSNTITAGVVSSVQRSSKDLNIIGSDIEYVQTDAAITYGNSGGPLVNLDGEVIGVNTMRVTAGISFAIPIDFVKGFLEKAESKVKSPSKTTNPRRYMGVTMLTLTPHIINELQSRNRVIPMDVTHGVLIWKVTVGSPAHNGGLKPGDVVTEINGRAVMGATTVYELLDMSGPLQLSVYRGGARMTLIVHPEET